MFPIRLTIVFILVLFQLSIYSSFVALDLYSGEWRTNYSLGIKFVSIIICWLLSIVAGSAQHDRRDALLLRLALLLSVVADYLLCLLELLVPGIAFFVAVQLVYAYRHSRGFKWRPLEGVALLFVFVVSVIIFSFVGPLLARAGIFWLGLIYVISLSLSVWMAIGTLWRGHYPMATALKIMIALFLFFISDLFVTLYYFLPPDETTVFVTQVLASDGTTANLPNEPGQHLVDISWTIKSILGAIIWIFYLPAQFLLALSAFHPSTLLSIFKFLQKGEGYVRRLSIATILIVILMLFVAFLTVYFYSGNWLNDFSMSARLRSVTLIFLSAGSGYSGDEWV